MPVITCCLEPEQRTDVILLYWSLADATSDMTPYEKLSGFRSGDQEGQKKGPPCRKDSIQVLCFHAKVGWDTVCA